MLINVKIPIIVGILTIMGMIKLMLSRIEREKFYNLGTTSHEFQALWNFAMNIVEKYTSEINWGGKSTF